MSKVELRYRKKQRMNALLEEITTTITEIEAGSKNKKDEVVIWNCDGFRGYRK